MKEQIVVLRKEMFNLRDEKAPLSKKLTKHSNLVRKINSMGYSDDLLFMQESMFEETMIKPLMLKNYIL